MARWSFATNGRPGVAPASSDMGSAVPQFQGLPAEASTLMMVVVVEAVLIGALRRYFRHSHGG